MEDEKKKQLSTLNKIADHAGEISDLLLLEHMNIPNYHPIISNCVYLNNWIMWRRYKVGDYDYVPGSYYKVKKLSSNLPKHRLPLLTKLKITFDILFKK